MKKLLVLLFIGSLVSFTAVAQEQKDVKKDKEEWGKKVKEELKLTDEQTVKYDALNKEYKEKFEAVMNDASLNTDAQKEKKMALKKEKEAKFFEFLTPEQQAKYKELIEKKKKDMASKPGV